MEQEFARIRKGAFVQDNMQDIVTHLSFWQHALCQRHGLSRVMGGGMGSVSTPYGDFIGLEMWVVLDDNYKNMKNEDM